MEEARENQGHEEVARLAKSIYVKKQLILSCIIRVTVDIVTHYYLPP
jgi:hypothetical protein